MERRELLKGAFVGAAGAIPALAGGLYAEHEFNLPSSARVIVPTFGSGPDHTADIQAALDTAESAGGGLVQLPAGNFQISIASGKLWCLRMGDNVQLVGEGRGTTLTFDGVVPADWVTALAGNPALVFRAFIVRIGTSDTSASNTRLANFNLVGVDTTSQYANARVFGIGARHDQSNLATIHSDNFVCENVMISNTLIPISCQKNSSAPQAATTARLGSQFRNWRIRNCTFINTGNKSVELQECNGGSAAFCQGYKVVDGVQAIFSSRNIDFVANDMFYTNTGCSVAQGSNNVRIIGGTYEAHPDATNPLSALILRTEAQATTSDIHDVTVVGATFRDNATSSRRAFTFATYSPISAASYHDVTFSGVVFDGLASFVDIQSPSVVTLKNIRSVAGTRFLGTVATVPGGTGSGQMNSSRIDWFDCLFAKAFALKSPNSAIHDCVFEAGLDTSAAVSPDLADNIS